jgi:Flp pilus assembly protein TadD
MNFPPSESAALWQEASRSLLAEDYASALEIARSAAARFPEHPVFQEIIAECAIALEDDVLAEEALRRLVVLQPRNLQALNNLGILYDRQQRQGEALQVYSAALTLAPEDPSVLTNLGILHEHREEYGLAEQLQRQARALAPRSAQIALNLAALLAGMERFEEAESEYRAAILLQPDFVLAYVNLGMMLADLQRFAEAEAAFRQAIRLDPGYKPAYTGLAPILLMQGNFAEGWACFEKRQTVGFFKRWFAADPARSACRYWQGENLEGKSVLVFPEQGFGDEIQFSRYLRLLKERGAARITQICYPEQKGIMGSLYGPDLVLSLPEAARHREGYDYWTLLMSLPCHLGTEADSIPAGIPYLAADVDLVKAWEPRLQKGKVQRKTQGKALGKRRVGLVWRGNPKHSNDADRSLLGIGALAPLWSIPGIDFISLCRPVAVHAEILPASQPMLDLGRELRDFSDVAAVLMQLDLLISVDTATAHLAGALGVPCWVLLPDFRTDWRWMRDTQQSPWYPAMRLFRQTRRGDWQGTVLRVRDALGEWC